jgi:hypothetical protein
MLFLTDNDGVPSHAHWVRVTPRRALNRSPGVERVAADRLRSHQPNALVIALNPRSNRRLRRKWARGPP